MAHIVHNLNRELVPGDRVHKVEDGKEAVYGTVFLDGKGLYVVFDDGSEERING